MTVPPTAALAAALERLVPTRPQGQGHVTVCEGRQPLGLPLRPAGRFKKLLGFAKQSTSARWGVQRPTERWTISTAERWTHHQHRSTKEMISPLPNRPSMPSLWCRMDTPSAPRRGSSGAARVPADPTCRPKTMPSTPNDSWVIGVDEGRDVLVSKRMLECEGVYPQDLIRLTC